MKSNRNILVLILLTMAGTVFGQETGWEFDHLQGKVKTFAEYDYEFDISDSINHDEFMRQFYICGFDVDKMLRFADSIKTGKDTYHNTSKEYDSLGQFTKLHDAHYINEYDDSGRIMKRIIEEESEPTDTIYFEYDEVGQLVKRKYRNRLHGWIYDTEGRLLEYIYKDIIADSILILEKYEYNKKCVLRRSEKSGSREYIGCSRGYYEYDSKGNVVFEREYDWGAYVPLLERKTKYKYDRNDSIIRSVCRETKWCSLLIRKDTIWQEIDPTGQTVFRWGKTPAFVKEKRKMRLERKIIRNTEGFPVEEVYEEYEDKASSPCFIKKKKYDELGRAIEEEKKATRSNPGRYKRVWKYYQNTKSWAYYAVYLGENLELDHESLYFYDNYGNCIAHVQWMPGNRQEYYFNVNRYEYYE